MAIQRTAVRRALQEEIREVVFGLEDSLVSTVGAITGIAAGTNNRLLVILSGFVIVAVEAISMAAGTFLSSKSHRDAEAARVKIEADMIARDPQGKLEELKSVYRERGFTDVEMQPLLAKTQANHSFWVEEISVHKLGVVPADRENPGRNAWYMGVSYVLAGIIPITPYFFSAIPFSLQITLSIVLTVATLFGVGLAKGSLTKTRKFRSAMEMVVISMSAALIGFLVGKGISLLTGIEVGG
jgi:VIT1/CCC1 family predicted Fe2+/Mn2+ transporter